MTSNDPLMTSNDPLMTSNDPHLDAQVGARRLRNMCLGYLARPADAEAQATCLAQFRQAACMTDSLAALTALADKPSTARDEALHTFYERAKANKEALVINKWLSVQACARSGL